MRHQRTTAAGETAQESSIHDCITGLDKIVLAVFDAHGQDAFKAIMNEVVRALENTIGSFANTKGIKSLDFLIMIDEEAERQGGIKVDFTLYGENPLANVEDRASKLEFRVEKIKQALSDEASHFNDLHDRFEETRADRLYNLFRGKAKLTALPQPINFVLYKSGRINSPMVCLESNLEQTNGVPNVGTKRPGTDLEQGSSKRMKTSDLSRERLVKLQLEIRDVRAREASLVALGDSWMKERKEWEPQIFETLPTLRSDFQKLSKEAAVMKQRIKKLQESQEEAGRTKDNLLTKNTKLEADSMTIQALVQSLQSDLQLARDKAARVPVQDPNDLAKIADLERHLGLRLEDIHQLQSENEKLKGEKSCLQVQNEKSLSLLEDERQENMAMKVAQSSGIAEWRIQRSELTTEMEELKAIIRAVQYSP